MVEIEVKGGFYHQLEQKFYKDIEAVKDGDTLLIDITSPGGEVDVLKRMTAKVLELKQRGVKIGTYISEFADSCGFFFFLLGDKREAAETATAHYHAPRLFIEDGFIATKTNMTEMLNDLNDCQAFTNDIFRSAVDMDDKLFALIENSELPMNRQNMLDFGIIN